MRRESLPSSVLALALALGSVPFGSWIMSLLWQWFIVPVGLPPVGVAQAFGISLLVGQLVQTKIKLDDSTTALYDSCILWGKLSLVLLVGYVTHRIAT